MTFKKLLKEAAKVDTSTFRLGPKVKAQSSKPSEGRRPLENTQLPKQGLPLQLSTTRKSGSPLPQKSIVERVASSISRSASPASPKTTSAMPSTSKMSSSKKSTSNHSKPVPSKPTTKSITGKDTKSRLRESFVPDELIALAQGPRRDLRTIEEIQNDLWRKKGKNYPSVNGKPISPTRPPRTSITTKLPLAAKKEISYSKKEMLHRKRDRSSSENSFVAPEDEEFDYRTEIRSMFNRGRESRMYSDSDDSDMEATGFEVEREEARATRLARLEDEEEERREEERRREKKKRKMEVEKRRARDGK